MANPTSYLDLLRDDNIDLLLAEGNSFDGHRGESKLYSLQN